ncbi:MBL fold metallo-hydrolase [Gorillibacterium timonense]|uniref:MBL fold metallo-hydrolase n=1 Tax=Gorillibacterium timonense TaxID=1689269 RepID=UPI00071D542A|nr:MBL fold metallo-hydrolase [Gorillibacterium timonense]
MKFRINTKRMGLWLSVVLCAAMLGACSKQEEGSSAATEKPTAASVQPSADTSKASVKPTADSTPSPAASAAPTAVPTIPAKPVKDGPLTIQYVGNSCFFMTFPDGTTIITDPYPHTYDQQFGPAPEMDVDAMSISHSHADHSPGAKQFKGNPLRLLPALMKEPIQVGGVEVTGFNSKHVANMGDNEIFIFRYGDLKIVHMGETDKIESPEARAAVKDADVVLAYAGGYGADTIKNAVRFKELYEMGVKVLIPQHFSNNPDMIFYGGPTIDQVLADVPKGITIVKQDEFVVTKEMKQQFVQLTSMKMD